MSFTETEAEAWSKIYAGLSTILKMDWDLDEVWDELEEIIAEIDNASDFTSAQIADETFKDFG